ncbi:hypothetical protein [Pseudomonas sp. C11]|uniref:hypothetical protein n=1 Tax=Pseudomonas sp. C11 TaxID=3075550 RepID=UPI002B002578|nr:hypothetical protein [Pseudomonas sp. C11]
MLIDIRVMDTAWRLVLRNQVTESVLAAMAKGRGQTLPSPNWRTTFRTIDEGSGDRVAAYCRISNLLASGVFSPTWQRFAKR